MGLVLIRLVWVVLAAVTSSDKLAPDRGIELDLHRKWWASTLMAARGLSRAVSLDLERDMPRFTVDEPNSVRVWVYDLDLPVDVQQYSLLTVRFSASNTRRGDVYFIALDDGAGSNTGGRPVFFQKDLVADGDVRELRADLRRLDVRGRVLGISLAVTSGESGPAEVNLDSVRFETAGKPVALADGPPIQVTVLDPWGKAVPGAAVIVDAERQNVSRTGLTDAKGIVQIRPRMNETGQHMLRVEKAGFYPAEIADVGREARLTLNPGAHYGGTIRDEDGEPIEGVCVNGSVSRRVLFGRQREIDFNVRTNAAGRWQSPILPASLPELSLRLAHPDCASDPLFGRARKEPAEQLRAQTNVIVLARGREIAGTVVDEAGRSVADATVEVVMDRWGPRERRSQTGRNGEFRMERIGPGPVSLRVDKPGFVRTTRVLDIEDTSDPIRIILHRGGTLEIVAKDAVTKKPIEGADMNVQCAKSGEWFQGHTDGTGTVRMHLATGVYRLNRVFKFASYRTHPKVEKVTVREDHTSRLEIRLSPLPVIRGRVVDATGRAVSAAAVRIRGPGYREVRSDDRGEFTLSWDPTDEPGDAALFRVLVATEEGRNLAAAVDLTEASEKVEVKLQPGATVQGRVLDETGKPVPQAKVYLRLSSGGRAWSFSDHYVTTDANGGYQVRPVPPGRNYLLSATADGFGLCQADVKLGPAGPQRVDVPPMVLNAASLSLGGVVTDGAGKGVLGVRITISGDNQRVSRTLTDRTGRFRVTNICRGQAVIEARLPEKGLETRLEAQGGENNLHIVLGGPAKGL